MNKLQWILASVAIGFLILSAVTTFAYTPDAPLVNKVNHYWNINKHRSHGGCNWFRVLLAFEDKTADDWNLVGKTSCEMTAYTAEEAKQSEKVWRGWKPIRIALEKLEKANAQTVQTGEPQRAAAQQDQSVRNHFVIKQSWSRSPHLSEYDEGGNKNHLQAQLRLDLTYEHQACFRPVALSGKICLDDSVSKRMRFGGTDDNRCWSVPAIKDNSNTQICKGKTIYHSIDSWVNLVDNNIVEGDEISPSQFEIGGTVISHSAGIPHPNIRLAGDLATFKIVDDDLTWVRYTKENNTWWATFHRPVQTRDGDEAWQSEDYWYMRLLTKGGGGPDWFRFSSKAYSYKMRVADFHRVHHATFQPLTVPEFGKYHKTVGSTPACEAGDDYRVLSLAGVRAHGLQIKEGFQVTPKQIIVQFPEGGMDVCGTVGFRK